MRNWYIGRNHYWRIASIDLEEVSAGLYYLENIVMWLCSKVPDILLPKIKFRLKDKENWNFTNNEDGWTDLRDWFGGTQSMFHSYVCMPTSNFVWKHTKKTFIPLPYDFLKETFPNEFDPVKLEEYDYDDDDLELLRKTEKLGEWTDKQFRKVLKQLDWNYIKNSINGEKK